MKKAALLIVFILTCNFIVAQDLHYFIKFEGIPGEVTDLMHKDWCDLESFNQKIRGKDVTESTRRTTTPKIITVVKKIDKASPKIMEALTGRKPIAKVEIDLTRPGEGGNKVFYKYVLEHVEVTKYTILADESERPTEEITLKFEKQKVIYTIYDNEGQAAGTIETEWSRVR